MSWDYDNKWDLHPLLPEYYDDEEPEEKEKKSHDEGLINEEPLPF